MLSTLLAKCTNKNPTERPSAKQIFSEVPVINTAFYEHFYINPPPVSLLPTVSTVSTPRMSFSALPSSVPPPTVQPPMIVHNPQHSVWKSRSQIPYHDLYDGLTTTIGVGEAARDLNYITWIFSPKKSFITTFSFKSLHSLIYYFGDFYSGRTLLC